MFKPYGKELEKEYTVCKSFPYSTSLETILAEIRAKAAEKAKEKEAKYQENKVSYMANQKKLAEGQKLFDQLTAAGKAEGFRMNGATLEKLSTWKAKGRMRSNWCHVDAIPMAKRALGLKTKPVLKKAAAPVKARRSGPVSSAVNVGPRRPNPKKAAAYTRNTVEGFLKSSYGDYWQEETAYFGAAPKDSIYAEMRNGGIKEVSIKKLREEGQSELDLFELINDALL